MESNVECFLLMVVVIIILTNSPSLYNSDLGNMIYVSLLVGFSLYNKVYGLIMLVVVISLKQTSIIEGMTGPEKEAVTKFKQKHCNKKGLVDKKGEKVSLEDIGSQFPKLNFDVDKCDPCDTKCKFKISSGSEQLHVMEGMRPESSNNFSVSKNITSNEKQVETFSNIFSAFTNSVPEPEPVLTTLSK